MAGLQSDEGRMMIESVVWTQYINVTDTETATKRDRQPRRHIANAAPTHCVGRQKRIAHSTAKKHLMSEGLTSHLTQGRFGAVHNLLTATSKTMMMTVMMMMLRILMTDPDNVARCLWMPAEGTTEPLSSAVNSSSDRCRRCCLKRQQRNAEIRRTRHQATPGRTTKRPNPTKPTPMIVAEPCASMA